jgi:hypothetical protein
VTAAEGEVSSWDASVRHDGLVLATGEASGTGRGRRSSHGHGICDGLGRVLTIGDLGFVIGVGAIQDPSTSDHLIVGGTLVAAAIGRFTADVSSAP